MTSCEHGEEKYADHFHSGAPRSAPAVPITIPWHPAILILITSNLKIKHLPRRNDYSVTISQISLCGYHHNHWCLHSCKAAVNCTTGFGIRTYDSRTKTNAIPDNINIPALQPATQQLSIMCNDPIWRVWPPSRQGRMVPEHTKPVSHASRVCRKQRDTPKCPLLLSIVAAATSLQDPSACLPQMIAYKCGGHCVFLKFRYLHCRPA